MQDREVCQHGCGTLKRNNMNAWERTVEPRGFNKQDTTLSTFVLLENLREIVSGKSRTDRAKAETVRYCHTEQMFRVAETLTS